MERVKKSKAANGNVLADEIIGVALGRARKEAFRTRGKKSAKAWLAEKNAALAKIRAFADYASARLSKASRSIPNMEAMHPFKREMLSTFIDIGELRKASAHTAAVAKLVAKLKRNFLGKVRSSADAQRALREFHGRAASVLRSASSSLERIVEFERIEKALPRIDFSLGTAVIAGVPNTGKTTLLSRLTGSKGNIAPYPFTTKGLLIGHFEKNHRRIQVVDCPGLLERQDGKRNTAEKRAIAALTYLANAVVFVVDPTPRCGYPLEEQQALLKSISREFQGIKVIVAINKADAASESEMNSAKAWFPEAVIEGEGIKSGLAEIIADALFRA